MPHETINTILVIDDTPDKLELMALMLQQTGYQVSTAAAAREGIKMAKLQPPDLIISDVSMPGMDGIELCRRVRADVKLQTVPIMLVTALRQDNDSVLAGLQAGADDYLEAPFDPMRLAAKVARLIERKRMEDAVRARERYYRTLIENASDLISILNADGSMRYQSPSLGRLLGYKPEELIAKSVFDFIHPEDKKEANEALNNSLLSPGNPVEVELRFRHKDDSWRCFVCTLTNLLDDPNVRGIISNAFDITERKRAEAALKENEAELNEAQRLAGLGSWYLEIKSGEVHWSKETFKIFGLDPARGTPSYSELGKCLTPESLVEMETSLRKTIEQNVSFEAELEAIRPDQSRCWMLSRGEAVRDETGSIVSVRGTVLNITERKQAEGEVQESRAWLTAIFDASRDGIVVEENDRIVYANDAMAAVYGYDSHEEVIGKNVSQFRALDEDQRLAKFARDRVAGEDAPSMYEYKGVRKDSSLFDVEVSVSSFQIGGKTYIVSTLRDITERKQAQKDLLIREAAKRRLAERQTAILNALPANICLIGSDGIILDVNIKWREFALRNNYTESNSGIGDNYLEACDRASGEWAEGGKAAAEGIRAVISGKSKRFELDYPCHSPDDQRWFKLMIAPIHEDPSEGVVIMHVNITEGVLAKMALSDMTLELEAAVLAYRQVLGKSLDVICTVDKEGRFIQVSAAAKDVWGYEPEELIGRRYMDLVHPDDRDSTALMATGIMAGVSTSDFDNRYLRKDGSVVDIMWSANWSEADGAMFCVARDVSQIKQAEKALEHSAEQLRQAQKLESVGRLAGGIAHDFNNMLTTIQGYSDLTLRRLETNDPLRSNIEEIKKAGERSAALTRQLLAFSRQQVLQPVVLDLNKVIVDTVTMLHRLIGEDIQLVTSFNPKASRVKVDPGQLTQIIMNLAVNARDAMPQGGKLTIETANVILGPDYASQHIGVLSGDYVMLAMSDDGMGMSTETQEHIFDPFFTTKEIGKGTGLGLATVYGIVKQSGGDIWVYSEEGVGTTFKIYLPQVTEQVDVAEIDDTSDELLKGTGSILLVEDEEMVRTLTCRILEDCGYTVIEAHNGAEALSMCKKGDCQIDLLMTDVVMPQMGGRELAERIAKIYPHTRILYTSGYTDDAVVRHGVIEAGTNFIQKPFTPHGLALKVREVLDSTCGA